MGNKAAAEWCRLAEVAMKVADRAKTVYPTLRRWEIECERLSAKQSKILRSWRGTYASSLHNTPLEGSSVRQSDDGYATRGISCARLTRVMILLTGCDAVAAWSNMCAMHKGDPTANLPWIRFKRTLV